MKVILITGASSGIGFEAAKLLAKDGNKVYGAARRVERLAELKSFGVVPVSLDITDEQSISTAISTIINNEGRIDILINNAGYGSYGPIEAVSIKEAKQQFNVNIFGLASITKQVLPYMRKQRSGRIINTSSMGGRFTSFMGAWYHATKYALEAFSDALRMEVKPFGIDVVIIEPSAIRTNWGIIAADHLKQSAHDTPYARTADKAAAGFKKLYQSKLLSGPMVVSKVITKAALSKHPRARYLVGRGARTLILLHTILPTRVFDKLMTSLY
ncbi:oxidoreductase [Nicoliella lavandulae]|uniref:Oxidoreductase n=1 Tax=Nicoliella lavandulae TaxID=3082954 RepID=A0ABU8SL80_9LACO